MLYNRLYASAWVQAGEKGKSLIARFFFAWRPGIPAHRHAKNFVMDNRSKPKAWIGD